MNALWKLSKDKCADHVSMQINLQSLVFRFLGRQTLTRKAGTGYILHTQEMPADM